MLEGILGLFDRVEFDKSEIARLSCIVIARNVNILDGTKIFEKVFKIASSGVGSNVGDSQRAIWLDVTIG